MQVPVLEGDSLIEALPQFIQIEEGEEWVPLPFNTSYAVSSFGRVFKGPYLFEYRIRSGKLVTSHRDARLLDPSKDSDGYPIVGISVNGDNKVMHVHRLVAISFIPNPESKPTVNHIDGNKSNNHVDNLEWATWGENNKHAISTGLRTSVVPIKCLDNGQIYESMQDAAKQLGLNAEMIRVSILQKYRLKEGYTFIKLDGSVQDEKSYLAETFNDYLNRSYGSSGVKISCLDTGEVFDTWQAAAAWLGVDSGAIEYAIDHHSCCKGHVFAKSDQLIRDPQKYMNLCYTTSKNYKSLATYPVHSLYEKAIVLSSGGLDSTTCLGIAVQELGAENVLSVSADYHQRHSRELECADAVAKYYGVKHYVMDLSYLYQYSDCSLLASSDSDIPEGTYMEQMQQSNSDRVATYVPFRNGLLLSSVAVIAQSVFPDDDVAIYIGAHADDAAGNAYPDCSIRFIETIQKALFLGTYNRVTINAPLLRWNKSQVVKKGLELKVPYELTTSCYNGREAACGKCGTCRDRIAAFRANGIPDPIEYEGEDPFADLR